MKTLRLMSALMLFSMISSVSAQGPGATAATFLLIQPSLRANGMGGASVSSTESDALGIAFNPARLGVWAKENYFMAEFYPAKSDWLAGLASGIFYDAKTFVAGYNLKKLDHRIPVSLGLGYSRVNLDLGEIVVSGPDDPVTPIDVVRVTENAKLWSIGLAVDHWIKAGFGWNFKSIDSNIGVSITEDGVYPISAKISAHDFGAVLYAPGDEILSRLTGSSLEIHPGLRPVFGLGLGYSKSNIGDDISYFDAAQTDPLPRTARVGLSLNTGLTGIRHGRPWRLVSLEHQYEAEQLLVRTIDRRNVSYANFLGDINFFKNVILRQENSKIITKIGWELGANEFIFLRYGHYKDPLGRVDFRTFGASLSSYGLLNAVFQPTPRSPTWIRLLTEHLDVRYDYSSYDFEAGHPLSGTDFHGMKISLF